MKNKIEKFKEILESPVQFAERMLGHQLWAKQREILESVARHPRTAVKACHSSGKTFTAAEAVLWWITGHPEAIAVTTAPTWTQVERLLWGEIHHAVDQAKIKYPKPSATALHFSPLRYAIGISTNEGVRFQGFHGNVLIVLDEAPGIKAEIWEAIEGIRAGGDVRVLALGNPTIASGPFYDAFTTGREGWNVITISAFDTPNLEGITADDLLRINDSELDQNTHPYLTTRRWVREKYHEWGPGHPLWEARVLGNFPSQAEDALLSLAWLEAAKYRELADADPCQAGLDVAGPGEDETVLCVRRGSRVVLIRSWTKADPRGEVVAALQPFRGQLQKIKVDSVGIGYYMAQHLRDQNLPVEEVNVGERPRDAEKYFNRKAELYWGLRQRAQAGDLSGLTDDRTIAQLAGIRYSHNSRGQVVIESKEDAQRRGVKSPDRGEAVMLAFAESRLPYGLLTYMEAQIARYGQPCPGQPQLPGSPPKTNSNHVEGPRCPLCEASCIQPVCTGGWRCGTCGYQFRTTPVENRNGRWLPNRLGQW